MALTPRDIGLRIKAAREAKHWTQQEFAIEAHISISSVSRWEGGKPPPVRELVRIADVLGIEPEWLVEPAPAEPNISEALARIEKRLEDLGGEVGSLREEVRQVSASSD